MRLRNVKNKDEILNNCNYLCNDYKQFKNFTNDKPIHVEIGMGKGDFIIGMAKKYPNINFIGIEKYDSVIVRAIQKLNDEQIPNLKLLKMDALKLNKVFDHKIDTIYLNFSDPWPKDRHAKRRLTHKLFLEKYDSIFKNKKHIIMKTDNRKLFEFSIKSFVEYGYLIGDISLDLHNDDYSNNVETEYEVKFSNKGFPIYMVDVFKN